MLIITPTVAGFPPRELLQRFLRGDRGVPVPLEHAAKLLGITPDTFRSMLDAEGGRRCTSALTWADAAAYLFDAWPRAQLLAALGPEYAGSVPERFYPTPVRWSIPIFIVQAMEHQAALDARGVHDYVTDALYNEIQPETLDAFRDDPAFLAAYHFPCGD